MALQGKDLKRFQAEVRKRHNKLVAEQKREEKIMKQADRKLRRKE